MKQTLKTLTAAILASFAVFAGASWNQYHGNAQHTGFIDAAGPSSFDLKWELNIGAPVVTSPVIGPDGTIYLGPLPEDKVLDPKMVITAVNPNGTIKWQFRTPFTEHDLPTFATPAVGSNGILYVGSTDGTFYALNPDGSVRWTFDGGDAPIIQATTIAADGTVYVGINGNLCAFTPEGALKWQVPIGDPTLPGGPAVAADGTVYTIFAAGETHKMLALNPQNGSKKWETNLHPWFWVLAPITVGPSGTIYVADANLVAINPDGSNKWVVQPTWGMSNYGGIAVDPSENIYASAYINTWKIRPDGSTAWEVLHTDDGFRIGHTLSGFLLDNQGRVYQSLGDGKRWAIEYEKRHQILNAANGAALARYDLPEIGGFSAPALGVNGTLYIGALDGKLRAFGGELPPQLTAIQLSESAVVGGESLNGTISLDKSAPAGGVTVDLTDNSSAITVPSSVLVPAGAASAGFDISTGLVSVIATRQITASYNDVSKVANLTLTPGLQGIKSNKIGLYSGQSATGTVMLMGQAPSGGATVGLSVNNEALTVPASATVAAGLSSANFTIEAETVTAITTVQLSASYGSVTKSLNITVLPNPVLTGFAVTPTTIQGGQTLSATISLDIPAPGRGIVVILGANGSEILLSTRSKVVPGGQDTHTFSVPTAPVAVTTTRSIWASHNGKTISVSITLTP